ncbi:MAG: ATP-binding protein [Methylococcales bacterium]
MMEVSNKSEAFRYSFPSIYKDLDKTLIRDDLWLAVLDFNSDISYVWDPDLQIAKTAINADIDETYLLPTLTVDEMNLLRTDFYNDIKDSLDDSRLDKLKKWMGNELPTKNRPPSIKKRWKKYRFIYVVKHLEAWVNNSDPLNNKIQQYADLGNNLSVGELYLTQLENINKPDFDSIFAKTCASWASPAIVSATINSISDLIEHLNRFSPTHLVNAIVHVAWRFREKDSPLPKLYGDLIYRLADDMQENSKHSKLSPQKNVVTAITETEQTFLELQSRAQAFSRKTSVTAKASSIALLKQAHSYTAYALSDERALLRELEVLIGPVFRKFCEGCERHQPKVVAERANEIRAHIQRLQESYDSKAPCRLANLIITPIIDHVASLVEEGTQQSDAQSAPLLSFFGRTIKLDLNTEKQQIQFSARLSNEGQGKAYGIHLVTKENEAGAILNFSDHAKEFDLAPGSERVTKLVLTGYSDKEEISIPVMWSCTTYSGRAYSFDDVIHIKQQNNQPNWNNLIENPPYGINPIKERECLYGRDKILGELELYISSGTSTFLSGQKRVGKTSVLQVVSAQIDQRDDATCIVLRMGELASLHEGQIAHTIATRLSGALDSVVNVPSEDEFGAGLGRLVPWVEEVSKKSPNYKFVVIIDEFDDLDPAFYTGERGKQFVKALRSLSEVGLTFFFVGSERMDAIYRDHSSDLNKWTSISLDRISSEDDCISLITTPVDGAIEFESDAVMSIIDYCCGNPFYMNLLCHAVFRKCWQEQRTYVGNSDLEIVRREQLGILGPTNFAHFWEDNPVLDYLEKRRQSAENCLFLCCLAFLGGAYESINDLQEAQESLQLPTSQKATKEVFRGIEARLLRRSIIKSDGQYTGGCMLVLPIFRDWLIENAIAQLLSIWCSYCDEQLDVPKVSSTEKIVYIDNMPFPIDEDDLLPISERLVYLGKQIDVAQIRSWLKQFDDDNRIEIAFLLLKRLSEKGFIDSGSTIVGLDTMKNSISAKRRELGDGVWKIIRNRLDNLCITFVDSEVKSGAATARELMKRMRPGRCAQSTDIKGWIQGHLESDPLVVFVDDFSASGNTIVKGLRKCWMADEKIMTQLSKEGRIVCCLYTALPEAIEQINKEFPDVTVLVMSMFDDDVKAFSQNAGIFEDDNERRFAQDVLLQIGRQLNPQYPLGYADMGALVAFHNTTPNNSLPVFWRDGTVNGRPWQALLPRA